MFRVYANCIIAKEYVDEKVWDDLELALAQNQLSDAERIAEYLLKNVQSRDHLDSILSLIKSALEPEYTISVKTPGEEYIRSNVDFDKIKQSIVVNISKSSPQYESDPEHIGKAISGTWVHLLRDLDFWVLRSVKPEDLYNRIVTTLTLNTPIATSDFTQGYWIGYEKGSVGIVFEGLAENVFRRDMVSDVDIFGNRVLRQEDETEHASGNNLEAWVIPQKVEAIAIIVHPDTLQDEINYAKNVADMLELNFIADTSYEGNPRVYLPIAHNMPYADTFKEMLLVMTPNHIVDRGVQLEAYLTNEEFQQFKNEALPILYNAGYQIIPNDGLYELFEDWPKQIEKGMSVKISIVEYLSAVADNKPLSKFITKLQKHTLPACVVQEQAFAAAYPEFQQSLESMEHEILDKNLDASYGSSAIEPLIKQTASILANTIE